MVTMVSCNNEAKSPVVLTNADGGMAENFFPVTSYLKGQIIQLKQDGINPQMITSQHSRHDTAWLKIEEFDNAFSEFLQPEIDSTNLTGLFKETRFADQTLDNYTFTYDPLTTLPATMPLQKWDVYINPGSNAVYRIYMVKKKEKNRLLQLTWKTGEYSKIVYLGQDENGNEFVEKEVLIKWKFD
jgi:hypothetical protein